MSHDERSSPLSDIFPDTTMTFSLNLFVFLRPSRLLINSNHVISIKLLWSIKIQLRRRRKFSFYHRRKTFLWCCRLMMIIKIESVGNIGRKQHKLRIFLMKGRYGRGEDSGLCRYWKAKVFLGCVDESRHHLINVSLKLLMMVRNDDLTFYWWSFKSIKCAIQLSLERFDHSSVLVWGFLINYVRFLTIFQNISIFFDAFNFIGFKIILHIIDGWYGFEHHWWMQFCYGFEHRF